MAGFYLIARITVKYGCVGQLNETMAKLTPIMEQDGGWRLIGSYSSLIGNLTDVYDIWEVPDANAVGSGLAAFAEHPQAGPLFLELQASLETEQLTLATPMPFVEAIRK